MSDTARKRLIEAELNQAKRDLEELKLHMANYEKNANVELQNFANQAQMIQQKIQAYEEVMGDEVETRTEAM